MGIGYGKVSMVQRFLSGTPSLYVLLGREILEPTGPLIRILSYGTCGQTRSSFSGPLPGLRPPRNCHDRARHRQHHGDVLCHAHGALEGIGLPRAGAPGNSFVSRAAVFEGAVDGSCECATLPAIQGPFENPRRARPSQTRFAHSVWD